MYITKITPLLAIASIFLLTYCGNIEAQTSSHIELLGPADFELRMEGNDAETLQIVDVRTPREYSDGYIEGAILMDISDQKAFEAALQKLDVSRPVLVYCAAGGRSAAATKLMASKGVKEVVELKGGMNAWKASGKKIEL
jgi:rhodanese-related sulfurtransferase